MNIKDEIKALKEQKNAVILAHYYVADEIQEIADYVGDSFALSKTAATLPNPIRFDSAHPSSYILKRQEQILRLMKLVPKFPPEEPTGSKKKKK